MHPTPETLAELFDAHASYVYRVLARFGVRDADLDDLTQEVFLVVLRRLDEFEGRAGLRTWLYSICRLCASNYRQRACHRREVLTEPPEPRVADDDSFQTAATRQLLERLDRALAALNDDQREVYVLYEIEQLTMPEVAEIMGCPVNTCYARLRTARLSVRATFERQDRSVA